MNDDAYQTEAEYHQSVADDYRLREQDANDDAYWAWVDREATYQ
jgi:hypothetical protein